jgi:hypothetical protein
MHVAGPLTVAEDRAFISTFHFIRFDGDIFEDFVGLVQILKASVTTPGTHVSAAWHLDPDAVDRFGRAGSGSPRLASASGADETEAAVQR